MTNRFIFAILISMATTASAQTTDPTFCERLAPQLQMKPVENGKGLATGVWRVNTLSGIGPALFGGTSTMSISIRPIGDPSYAEATALIEKACETTKGGTRCTIDGPMRVKIGTRKGVADLEAKVGDLAEIEIKGVIVLCRDPQAIGKR
ncbi:hypothetical protein [Sphingomonas sp. 37zxx]|uniref:hypothetical protein n=1 Tax=Sphingomonas sp. 37zxx TaxID=1550073 RepID=UPI0012DFFBA1|nr:hypothetical protein [Sphingomonas sp. 37zxx]